MGGKNNFAPKGNLMKKSGLQPASCKYRGTIFRGCKAVQGDLMNSPKFKCIKRIIELGLSLGQAGNYI
jgi:hypothetical protein